MAVEAASAMTMQIRADVAAMQSQVMGPGMPAFNALAGVPGQEMAPSSFADSMKQALQTVNAQDREAGERMADVDSGRSDDLVGAMLASQEASLSFSMLMQVRNKMVGAVDELIKLQL